MQFKSFIKDRQGASLVEYTILVGLISASAVVLIGAAGTKVTTAWATLNTGWVWGSSAPASGSPPQCNDCTPSNPVSGASLATR